MKPTLSLQLFSLRGLGSLEAQLSAAARAGFRSVEPLESHLRNVGELRDGLRRHQLTAPTAHVSLEALRTEGAMFVDACHSCGIGELFVPHPAPSGAQETASAWQRLGRELGALADRFKGDCVQLGYHNKTAGFTRLHGGRYGFELMFDTAKGSPLAWQADIAWLARAGVVPGEWLHRYASVLASAHVKDQAPDGAKAEEEGWSDVGSGILVWPLLWRTAIANGARTLVVEHDNPQEPYEFAARSFAYVTRFMS